MWNGVYMLEIPHIHILFQVTLKSAKDLSDSFNSTVGGKTGEINSA